MILTQTLTLTLACSVHFQKINHCKLLIIIHNLIICHWHDVNVKQHNAMWCWVKPFVCPHSHRRTYMPKMSSLYRARLKVAGDGPCFTAT